MTSSDEDEVPHLEDEDEDDEMAAEAPSSARKPVELGPTRARTSAEEDEVAKLEALRRKRALSTLMAKKKSGSNAGAESRAVRAEEKAAEAEKEGDEPELTVEHGEATSSPMASAPGSTHRRRLRGGGILDSDDESADEDVETMEFDSESQASQPAAASQPASAGAALADSEDEDESGGVKAPPASAQLAGAKRRARRAFIDSDDESGSDAEPTLGSQTAKRPHTTTAARAAFVDSDDEE